MAATGTPTPNIGLRIPLGTDPASVDDINYNSNLLDTKLGAVGSDSVQDQIDTLNGNIASKFNVSSNQIISNLTYSKSGAVVSIFATGVSVSASTSWTKLADLSDSLSPQYSAHFMSMDGTEIQIYNSAIRYRASSARTIFGVFTYVAHVF